MRTLQMHSHSCIQTSLCTHRSYTMKQTQYSKRARTQDGEIGRRVVRTRARRYYLCTDTAVKAFDNIVKLQKSFAVLYGKPSDERENERCSKIFECEILLFTTSKTTARTMKSM